MQKTPATDPEKRPASAWIRNEVTKQPESKTNIDLFLNDKPDEIDKYTMFNEWCEKEGVYMPKLEYPADFGGGLLGARCKEDIQHREVYLYIPYKMLISVKQTKEHAVLAAIIDAHPEVFGEEREDSWEQVILALRLIYEFTLGKEGYWYPYLRMMPDVEFTCAWEDFELEMTQDTQLTAQLQNYDDKLQLEWENMETILNLYPEIFP